MADVDKPLAADMFQRRKDQLLPPFPVVPVGSKTTSEHEVYRPAALIVIVGIKGLEGADAFTDCCAA